MRYVKAENLKQFQDGFTLLEILIALAIVATITVLSQRGLSEILKLAGRINQQDEHIHLFDAVFSQMELDFSEVELYVDKNLNPGDTLLLIDQGLLIRHTSRQPSFPLEQIQTLWTVENQSLIRASQSFTQTNKTIQTESLPIIGMRIRLWSELSGWAEETVFGRVQALKHETPTYEGKPITLNLEDTTLIEEGFVPGVRAIEITLTLKTEQSAVRIFNLGGKH